MKITRTTDIQPAVQPRAEGRARPPLARGDDGPTRTSLSKDASFVTSIREEARAGTDIRADKVAEARSLLDSGGLEASIDMDAMLDSLMADL